MKAIFLTAIFFLFTLGATSAMNIFASDFQNKWDEISKDIEKLNRYTATHNYVEIKGVKVENIDLDGAIFNGAIFDSVDFNNVSSNKSRYIKVKFKKCKFVNFRAWSSEFIDVIFENCEFLRTNVLGSTVMNVKIKGCKGEEAEFDDLRGNELVVEDTELNDRSSFTDGKIPFTFRNTTLSGVNMMGLSGGNALLIEGGILDEVNFGDSHFSTVTLRRVRQGEGGVYINGVTAESINFEDVEMLGGTGVADAMVNIVRIVGGRMYGPTFKDSDIATTYIRNAFVTRFALGNMGKVHVDNSTMHRSGFFQGGIDEMIVYNSTLDEIVGKNFKADIVMWDNVTLDGKIDLTNAQVNDFRPTRLKRGPRLQLITTGSNMRFN